MHNEVITEKKSMETESDADVSDIVGSGGGSPKEVGTLAQGGLELSVAVEPLMDLDVAIEVQTGPEEVRDAGTEQVIPEVNPDIEAEVSVEVDLANDDL